MPDWTNLTLFFVVAAVLLLTPGPAVLYIVARSIDGGRMAGIVSVLGISVGTLFHIFAAALGLSFILASSAFAFTIVKYMGAAYLIFLGLKNILSREKIETITNVNRKRLRTVFYEGVLVNLLNPKTALFFLAFLPQFVDPSKGLASIQIISLGILFLIMAIISDGLYALLAGTIGNWLNKSSHFQRNQKIITGGIYISLGILAVFSDSGRSK